MMTDFVMHIRARLGQRLGTSLDQLAPMISRGQARRAHAAATQDNSATDLGPHTSFPTAPAHLVEAAHQSAPQTTASRRASQHADNSTLRPNAGPTAEQTALAPLRAAIPHPISAAPAPQGPSQPAPMLRLVTNREATDTSARSDVIAPNPSASIADRPQKSDGSPTEVRSLKTPVSGPAGHGQNAIQPTRIITPAARVLQALFVQASRRRSPPADAPVQLVTHSAPSENATSISRAALTGMDPITAYSPAPAQSDQPVLTDRNKATSGAPVSRVKSALAALDQELPRQNTPLNTAPTSQENTLKTDAFADEEQLRATLTRILADDLRRHGLIPDGGI
ncbi:hypothetical protein ACJ5NV_13610 [Loktanella agnita]|uniref:hypothetical protein n=1 Tax=Loktanella agnita TaxID=287097 RepID=UPI00398891A0